MKRCPLSISILWLLLLALVACDTELAAQIEKQQIMQDADLIFSRSEFKQFRSQSSGSLFSSESTSSHGPGEGGGGSASGSGSGAGNSPKSSSSNSSSPESSGSSSSPSSGMGSFGDFGSAFAGLFKLLGILAIAAMLILVVWLVATNLWNRDRLAENGEYEGFLDQLASQLEASEYKDYSVQEALKNASKYAEQGKFREAVAFVLLAAMSWTEAEGFIRPRRGLTHRDYSRALRRHQGAYQAYRQILKIYEPLGFGRREANRNHYQTAVQEFQKGFREQATIPEN